MKIRLRHLPLACLLLASSQAVAQGDQGAELEALREEVRAMRTEYEARIADLEARLDAAENPAADKRQAAPVGAIAAERDPYEPEPVYSAQTVSVARDSSFNPAIGVTFQGQAWSYRNAPEDYMIPGNWRRPG
jgi:hypothetical protein